MMRLLNKDYRLGLQSKKCGNVRGSPIQTTMGNHFAVALWSITMGAIMGIMRDYGGRVVRGGCWVDGADAVARGGMGACARWCGAGGAMVWAGARARRRTLSHAIIRRNPHHLARLRRVRKAFGRASGEEKGRISPPSAFASVPQCLGCLAQSAA